jgi:hypothetical protein
LPVPVLAAASILITVTNLYTNAAAGAAPGAPAPGPAGPKRPYGTRTRVAALIAACAVVAGGAFAVTDALSGSAAPAAATASTATGPTGQAAVLNTALSDASYSTATTSVQSTPAATKAALRRVRRALARLRLLGGMHGQFTFQTKNGPRTLAFERGTIISIASNGADVTVRATDGTMWTWVLTSTSIVREDGTRTTASKLAVGQLVFAGGAVTGATHDALLMVIREPAKSSGVPS